MRKLSRIRTLVRTALASLLPIIFVYAAYAADFHIGFAAGRTYDPASGVASAWPSTA
jgi:hypothetical protein